MAKPLHFSESQTSCKFKELYKFSTASAACTHARTHARAHTHTHTHTHRDTYTKQDENV